MKFDAQTQVRRSSGKGVARQLRRNGKIPGVLYGRGTSILLTIDPAVVRKILLAQGGSTGLITVQIQDDTQTTERVAVIQDYQVDPITGAILHVDFFEVSMDKPVRVKVQVRMVGETPIGVKRDKGVLHHSLRELHVECLPGSIPDQIDVDASALGIGQGIHVRDLQLDEGLRILDDADQMVVNVSAPISEEKLAAMLTVEGAEVAAGPATPAAGAAAPEAEKEKTKTEPPSAGEKGPEGKK